MAEIMTVSTRQSLSLLGCGPTRADALSRSRAPAVRGRVEAAVAPLAPDCLAGGLGGSRRPGLPAAARFGRQPHHCA